MTIATRSPELAIFVGLPASGKTTFYRRRLAATHDRVSKDAMPHVRDRGGRQRRLIAEALASGRSVVVDNTNPGCRTARRSSRSAGPTPRWGILPELRRFSGGQGVDHIIPAFYCSLGPARGPV